MDQQNWQGDQEYEFRFRINGINEQLNSEDAWRQIFQQAGLPTNEFELIEARELSGSTTGGTSTDN